MARFEFAAKTQKAVAPTPSTLLQLQSADFSNVSGTITNESLTEELSISVSESWDGRTQWATLEALNSSQFPEPIAPQESKHFEFDCSGLKHMRIQGTASGAGLTATVAVQQTHAAGHR